MAEITPHPTPEDLANLAEEKLGGKKTERILQHCKRCPTCADALLEAVSNRPIAQERIKLSKWNWISIALMLVAIVALFGLMLWLLVNAGREPPELAEPVGPVGEVVYREPAEGWFEGLFAHGIVMAGGEQMLRIDGLEPRLLDLASGSELDAQLRLDYSGVMAATIDGNGNVARRANRRRDLGWWIGEDGEQRLTSIPHDAVPVWAAGNVDVAWARPPGTTLFLGYPPEHRAYEVDGRVIGIAWAPSADAAFALVMNQRGNTTLVRARRSNTRAEVVREDLDASALPNGLAVSPDGRGVFLALAGAGAADAEARHRPDADRDLDIYRVDVEDGDLQAVVRMAGDDFWPVVAGNHLYWTHNDHDASVVVLPLGREDVAPAHPIVGHVVDGVDAQRPGWAPGGERLAFTRGGWRLADWGLPFDAATIAFADGAAVGTEQPLVAGYHQDLTPAFSPDGRWLAYRSRRAQAPVPYYSGPGVADDIFVAPLQDGRAGVEQRITEDGWEVGDPSWSPDGRRLVFDTWDRNGVPRVARPWIVSFDPQSGEVSGRDPVLLPEGIGGSVAARWSPAGDELLLVERTDPTSQTLWIAPLGEARAARLVDFASSTDGGADWLPDGSAVVFAASIDGRMQLMSVPVEGGEPSLLSAEDADLLHPRVSPDGRWVAATRVDQRKEVRRLALDELR